MPRCPLQEITIFRRFDRARKNYQAALSHHIPTQIGESCGSGIRGQQPISKTTEEEQEEEEEEAEVANSSKEEAEEAD